MSLAKSIKEAMSKAGPRPADPAWVERPANRMRQVPPTGPMRTIKPRKVKPARPVDLLALYFRDRPETLVDISTSGIDLPLDASILPDGATPPRQPTSHALIKPPVPGLRGPLPILEALAKRGIRCIASADGAFYVTAEAGRLDEASRAAITAAAPLIRAYLHRSPLRCALPAHTGGEPPEAVTLAVGGAPWCGQCG